jgi:hypothetical protein
MPSIGLTGFLLSRKKLHNILTSWGHPRRIQLIHSNILFPHHQDLDVRGDAASLPRAENTRVCTHERHLDDAHWSPTILSLGKFPLVRASRCNGREVLSVAAKEIRLSFSQRKDTSRCPYPLLFLGEWWALKAFPKKEQRHLERSAAKSKDPQLPFGSLHPAQIPPPGFLATLDNKLEARS